MALNGFISPKASIDGSAFIGNNVRIFGAATIGPDCYLDDNVVIGYPSKEALTRMVKKGNIPTDLSELDKYADNQTVLSNSCCVRYGSVISVGSSLAEEVYCDVRTQVGANCRIGSRTQLLYGSRIYNDVIVGSDCRVGGFCCNRSVIEDKVSMFGELVHAYRKPVGGLIEPSPVIRKAATIGWHAIIIGGIEIGEGSYVAAGATVTKDVLPGCVVVGPKATSMPLDDWIGSLGEEP
ncbi:MAG: hypothetical protein M3R69_17335 [Acidobacteriota bacterium]|nr:hypothetical protein [Acidobacteriota bacterium]